MDLFIDAPATHEKTAAAEVALPEDPNAWGNEILQELFKQVPYIADFDPEVVLDPVDGERGFGFGHVLVGNKTELPPHSTPEALEASGVKQVRIPIVIKEIKLQPFDLLVTAEGKILPLTETRLREALFRPQNFDMTARSPSDTSLISQLYPPMRQNIGGGMAMHGDLGSMKMGASITSPLDAVLSCVLPSHLEGFLHTLGDATWQPVFLKNAAALAPAFQKITATEPASIEKRAALLPHVVAASVVQIAKRDAGYEVKTASHHMWAPLTQVMDRGTLVARFGGKVALAADVSGGVTIADDATGGEEESGPAPELIKDFGVYRVQDEGGRDLVGYVFPNLIDVDGRKLPMALFTNGSQSAVQAEIVGVRVGDAAPLHEGKPKGHGAFFTLEGGEVEATLPLEIRATFSGAGNEVTLQAETMDGSVVEVRQQPNLEQVMLVDGVMLVPDDYRWLSLEGSDPVVLVGAPEDVGKEARALAMAERVVIRGEGDCFSIDGLPVMKVAEEQRHFVTADDALFLLAGLGVDMTRAQRKLATASLGRAPVEVCVGREIKTASEQMHEARHEAAELLERIPDLRRVLFKEAALIPDPVAADTVLSLGFINPENMNALVRSLPKIEEGQQQMCQLLLAARLGLKEIPIYALERSIHATEEVLEGLKVLAFQKN